MRGKPNRDRLPPVQLLPPCGVCGQKAAGFHYGVTTCEACKGFFRRSLLRTKPYECVQTRQCRIGASTARRESCPKCRYDKCISVGMSKEAIKTGRYSLLKKSKDIYDLLQHQQSSSSATLDEEVRIKVKQTLEKINKAKRRGRANHCGEFPLPRFVNTTKFESDLISSPLKAHFTKRSDKISDPSPSNEFTPEVSNEAKTPIQCETYINPQSNPFSSSRPDDIKYQASNKSLLSCDDTPQYNSSSHTHCHDWSQALPVAAGARSSSYPYPPTICQCVQRHPGIHHNNVTMDHPSSHNTETCGSYHMREHDSRSQPSQRTVSLPTSSLNFSNDGPSVNWAGNPYIHPKEYPRTERVSDTYPHLLGSGEMGDYLPRSPSNQFHKIENVRSSPLPAYLYRDEQDGYLHSVKSSRERIQFLEKEKTSPYTISEPTIDYFPVKSEPISPRSRSNLNRSQNGIIQVRKELQDVEKVDNVKESTFQNLVAHSQVGEDNSRGCSSYSDHVRGDKCVEVDHTEKQNTDESSVCSSESRGVYSGDGAMIYEQEEDNPSGPVPGCSKDNRLDPNTNECCRKNISESEQNTALPPGKSDDFPLSNFEMPRFKVGTDTFELPFIEAFPYIFYENVLKSIIRTCDETLFLERDTKVNSEGIGNVIKSIWEKVITEVIESSAPAVNSLPKLNECKPSPKLSTRSAFATELLDDVNISDYNVSDLEDVISGLIKSHEEMIGPDSNYLSERQVQTALNVFQGLRRFKQELLGPYEHGDSDNIWNSSDQDLDTGRDMVSRYSLRSNKNIPKVLMFYRSVPGFRHLSTMDKVTLVKGAITEFLMLSSLRGMDNKTLTVVDAINLMTFDLSTMAFAFPLLGDVSMTMQLVSQEIKHLKLSKDILIVLKAISLMTPDRPNLENTEQVKQMYKPLHACLQLLLKKQYGESNSVYHRIGTLFDSMRVSIEKFKQQRDDNLKKLVEDIHVPLFKETVFHFLFE